METSAADLVPIDRFWRDASREHFWTAYPRGISLQYLSLTGYFWSSPAQRAAKDGIFPFFFFNVAPENWSSQCHFTVGRETEREGERGSNIFTISISERDSEKDKSRSKSICGVRRGRFRAEWVSEVVLSSARRLGSNVLHEWNVKPDDDA